MKCNKKYYLMVFLVTILVAVMATSCFGQHKIKNIKGQKYPQSIIQVNEYGDYAFRSPKSVIRAYSVGDTVGGGLVVWIDPNHSYNEGVSGTRGLIAAFPEHIDTLKWSDGTTVTGATYNNVYSGDINTDLIVQKDNANFIGSSAYAFDIDDYGDWYIPTQAELILMLDADLTGQITGSTRNNQMYGVIQGDASEYWTSRESDGTSAVSLTISRNIVSNGDTAEVVSSKISFAAPKSNLYRVWRIRRF